MNAARTDYLVRCRSVRTRADCKMQDEQNKSPEIEPEFQLGEGKVSGVISCFLGILSLLAVFCFWFPEILTNQEINEGYQSQMAILRHLLFWAIVFAFALGIISVVLSKRKMAGFVGVICATAATFLGGSTVEHNKGDYANLTIGLDWFVLALFVHSFVFVPIERIFPLRREQRVFRDQWRTDLFYFALSTLLVQLIVLFMTTTAHLLFGWAVIEPFQSAVKQIPVVLQFLIAVFVADLAQYWVHRAYHEWKFLWKFHAIHHGATTMDWMAGNRLHIVEILITRTSVFATLYVMGFSPDALYAYILLISVQAVVVHANLGINFGFLRYLIVTPQYHHWHHSDDPEYAFKNYAVHLPVIDMMFGTFKLPGDKWPETYGVLGDPPPPGFIGQTLYPFQSSRKEEE